MKSTIWTYIALALLVACGIKCRGQFLLDPYRFAVASNPLDNDLIAYWKFDQSSPLSSQPDSGPNAITLTGNNTGGISSVAGKITNAVAYASGWFCYYSNTGADLDVGNIDFSFSGWFQIATKTGTRRPLAGKWNHNNAAQQAWLLTYVNATDRFAFMVNDGSGAGTTVTATTFGSPSLNTWYFIAVWHDAANDLIGISVNGGSIETASYSDGSIAIPLYAWTLGTDGTHFLVGNTDECAFWKNRVLTPDEITELYDSGNGITCCPFP